MAYGIVNVPGNQRAEDLTGTLPIANGGTGTTTGHIAITSGSNTTSTASPAHGGTFTAIDSITKDTYGHVTAVNTKTVTLPSDNNTDVNVTNTATNPTSAATWYLTGTTNASTVTGTLVKNTGMRSSTLTGTADTDGYNIVILGNGTASGTAGNYYGMLRLYGTNAYYTNLRAGAPTANRTFYTLPGTSGYLVSNGSTTLAAIGGTAKPVYMASTGVITACSSTVGSTTQPVYMNAGTITAMSGALSVTYGGTGATTLTSGAALIGNGTGAVTTRSITNTTSAATAISASTNLITSNTLRYALNRTTGPTAADTNYTTYMMRSIAASTTDLTAGSSSLTSGAIYLVYE